MGKCGKSSSRDIDVALERCHKAASLYLRGRTYAEIAKELGVCRETINRDMKRARTIWRKRASRTYQKHLYEQLARLDEIEQQAWIGWERSLKDSLETGTEDGESPMGNTSRTTTKRRRQSGNATFLKVIQDTVRQRSELLGLLDPEARNSMEQTDADVVSVVIESRDEADEFRSLSLAAFRSKLQEAVEEELKEESAEVI